MLERYNLTADQLNQYNNALKEKYTESITFFDVARPREEWIAGHINFCKKFQGNVQTFFTTEQYELWRKDNRNSDQIRRYRENLALTDAQLDQLLQTIEESKKALRGVAKQKISEKERTAAQRKILDNRNTRLVEIVGSQKSAELILAIDLEDKAAFVRTYFPQFSYNLSYKIGLGYLNFTYAVRRAEESGKSPKEIETDKHSAHESLFSEMKQSLSPTEYAEWYEYHLKYHDNQIQYNHDMTPQQYEVFKSILNQRAIDRLAVVKAGYVGEERINQLDSIDARTVDRLSKEISVNCAQMWKKNARPNN